MAEKLLLMMSVLLISGCAFLPTPLAWLNYARIGYDVNQMVVGDSTTSDVILSSSVDMDCKLLNALDGEAICVKGPKG
jgi:hypothetical protein